MTSLAPSVRPAAITLPSLFLNGFKLDLPSRTPWRVSLYTVTPEDDASIEHVNRGAIKNAVWRYKFSNPSQCSGTHSFVLDIDESTVAVPTTWNIPKGTVSEGYSIVPDQDVVVSLDDPKHNLIVSRLLKVAFSRVFKNMTDTPLGPLWQNYNDFCQIPGVNKEPQDYLFCRKFRIEVLPLAGRRWCTQVRLSTQTVDGKTFAEHANSKEHSPLSEWINLLIIE